MMKTSTFDNRLTRTLATPAPPAGHGLWQALSGRRSPASATIRGYHAEHSPALEQIDRYRIVL